MTWQGRRLTGATGNGNTLSYSYDENGLRTQKTVNGTATQYRYHGSVLISQVTGSNKLLFSYDANGNAVAVNYNGTYYYYVRNGQNDVIRLIDGSNNTVVEYSYDSWGKVLSTTGSLASTLGTQNPFRYRGYVYDTETGLYYLQTRYYDPEVGRFINADAYVSTGQGVLGNNMYAYCANGPIARYDVDGLFIDAVFDIVSLCFSIADVIANPTDPLAWAGLVVDVVCLVTPGLTGGGTFVRAVGKIDDVADVVKTANKVDNVVDTAKTVKKGWKVGDDVASLTRAGNTPSWSTVRQRYWKNEAFYNPSKYPNDISRMEKGLAPIGDDFFPMELHHPYGRNGENFFIFEPLSRTDHRFLHNTRY